MTDQERINESLQRQIDAQNARIDNVLTKVDTIIGEMRDRDNQRAQENSVIQQEIRDRDNQRAQEIRDRDNQRAQEMRDRDKQWAEDIREIRASLEGMGKHVRNMAITSMAAIGAMVVTVIISILKS